jgi:hypothetical protein
MIEQNVSNKMFQNKIWMYLSEYTANASWI